MTSKEKKKILRQFAQIDNRINDLLAEQKCVCDMINTSGECLPGGVPDGSKVEKSIERLEDINAKILREINKLCDLKDRILSAIQEMPNITERTILWLHYIGKAERGKYKRLKLWQIANEIGYSHDRVKHMHGMALLHLKL